MKRSGFLFNRVLVRGLAVAGTIYVLMSGVRVARTQTLNYSTTWLGNTFGGGANWVQNFVEGMWVAPDGTVYTASGWDEGGREFGIYRNGQIVGVIPDTHGWGTGGGKAIVANDKYIFIAHTHGNEGGGLKGEQYPAKGLDWVGVSRRNKDGSHAPFDGGKGRFGDMLVLHEVPNDADAPVRGLALDKQGRLYVSDGQSGEIKLFDSEKMTPIASWKVPRSQSLAFDARGFLWVLQEGEKAGSWRALCFSRDGVLQAPQILFTPDVVPTSLAFDASNALYVSDNGRAQQILIYKDCATKPRLWRTFGERGGIMGGKTPGRNAPQRFSGPMGVGVDATGNLYVGCNQAGGGTILRSFDLKGKMRWELLGLEFVDGADVDPASDGADVWTTENRYSLDWSRPAGKQWTWRSQTADPSHYPDDPRLNDESHDFAGALFRRINGKPFLVVRGMYQHALVIYQIKGEIAIPSVMFSKSPYRSGRWKNVPQPAKGRWMWRDLNGNGGFEANEFLDSSAENDPESWAWWMDEAGGVWQGQQDGAQPIRYYPLQGLDRFGNPIYTRATSKTFALPAPMNLLLRIEYSTRDDVMYLTGHTTERPKTGNEWGEVGSEILRFDGWSKGNRVPRWRIALPYQPATAVQYVGSSVPEAVIKSFCVAGDVAFAVESRTAKVHVYDMRSGAKLGEMTPGPEVFKESGWVDFPDAIRAYRRKNGEYLVFVEEDAKGKIIVYRWKP